MRILKSYDLLLCPCMTVVKTILLYKQKLSSIIMLLALAWLTISLPFVYAQQQEQKASVQKQVDNPTADDDSNSVSNPTEEKSENGGNTLSEYLHESHHAELPGSFIVKYYKCHTADLYIAYHPDLICPPPDARLS